MMSHSTKYTKEMHDIATKIHALKTAQIMRRRKYLEVDSKIRSLKFLLEEKKKKTYSDDFLNST